MMRKIEELQMIVNQASLFQLKEVQIVKQLSSLHQEVALPTLLLLVKLIIVNSLVVIV